MGLLVVIIGIVVMLVYSLIIGLIIVLLGIALFAWPAAPYGYSHWHGRRAPP